MVSPFYLFFAGIPDLSSDSATVLARTEERFRLDLTGMFES